MVLRLLKLRLSEKPGGKMRSEKGSALIMGLIAMLLLWTLGMTLVLITARNASARELSSSHKKSFYIADGGLRLAKDALLVSTEAAFATCLDKLDLYIEHELEDFLMIELEKELSGNDSEYMELECCEDGNVTARLRREDVDGHLNEIFKKEYWYYFLTQKRLEVVRQIEAVDSEDVLINVKDDHIKFDLVDAFVMEVAASKSIGATRCVIECRLSVKIPDSDFGHIEYELYTKPLGKSIELGEGVYGELCLEVPKSVDARGVLDLESLVSMSDWVRRR